MGKIKLNLVSGSVLEKPLISAFSINENNYVILDDEMNGSMGLPIILVCKLVENKLSKIEDQSEWTNVKEHLKNIISGQSVSFIKIAEELSADDNYYTQLTLPVASFDALKKTYVVPEDVNTEIAPQTETIENIQPTPEVVSADPAPVENVVPSVEPVIENTIQPVTPEVVLENPSAPVVDLGGNTSTEEVIPVVESEVATTPPQVNIEMPQVEVPTGDNNAAQQVEPIITPTPVIDTNIPVQTNNDENNIFKEQKEAFMQACENMFDALVQKFERELDNKN